jgi:hypothetical protein
MYNLGRELLEEDRDAALGWWHQAAEAGSQEASTALADLDGENGG